MGATAAVSGLKYQGVGKRFVAVVVDMVVLGIVGYLIALVTGGTTEAGYELSGVPALLLMVIGLLYYVLLEAYVGGTLGKLVLGMRVAMTDGSSCTLQAAVIRNVLRIVDGLPLAYLLGAILVWNSSSRQRLGDRVANTVVVGKG